MSSVPTWAECAGDSGGDSSTGTHTQSSNSSTGVCIAPGMDSTTVMSWPIVSPFILFVLVQVVAWLLRLIFTPSGGSPSDFTGDETNDLSASECEESETRAKVWATHESDTSCTANISTGLFFGTGVSASEPLLPTESEGERSALTHRKRSEVSGTTETLPAVVRMALFCYAGLLDRTFKLLNCVPVCELLDSSGNCIEHKSVLFYAGGVECGAWQWLLWLLLLALVLLPGIPVLIWTLRCILPATWQEGTLLHLRTSSSKFLLTIHMITSEPFVESHWQWPAMLVVQRLMMVSVTVVFNGEVERSIGVTLVALFGLLLQVQARPYKTQWVNTLQSIANTCLVSLAVFNYASGVFFAVGFDPADTPLSVVQDNLDIAMLLLVLLPPLFFAFHMIRNMRRKEEVEVEAERGSGHSSSMYSGSLNGNGNCNGGLGDQEVQGGMHGVMCHDDGSDRSTVPRAEMEDARSKEKEDKRAELRQPADTGECDDKRTEKNSTTS